MRTFNETAFLVRLFCPPNEPHHSGVRCANICSAIRTLARETPMRVIRKISLKHGCELENCPIQVWSVGDTGNVSQPMTPQVSDSAVAAQLRSAAAFSMETASRSLRAYATILLVSFESALRPHPPCRPRFFIVLYSRRFRGRILRFAPNRRESGACDHLTRCI